MIKHKIDFNFLTKNIIPADIVISKAKGVKLWDDSGKEYLDFSSQTLNLNLGNSPEIVKEAFLEQFAKFTFLSTRFTSRILVDLAKTIANISPIRPCKINLKLTNGGDANESAFKRVRSYSHKPMIVSFYWSHLGEGCETLVANGKDFGLKNFSGSRHFIHLRSPFELIKQGYGIKESGKMSLEELEHLFKEREDIAGFIMEPIMVNAGGYIHSKDFLIKVRELCTKYNIALIFDEVQTGFGWLGTMFASQHYGVIPDIMTLGKSLGCGFPIAGILMKEKYDVLDYGEDEFTYGGHPISCAIALKNIQFLQKSSILKKVNKKSMLLKKLLTRIKLTYPLYVKEVRVCGLITSIEFVNSSIALLIYDRAINNGLITRKSMDGKGSSLILKPPLIVTIDEIHRAIIILSQSVASVANMAIK